MADQRNLNLVHGPIFRFKATTRILKRRAQKYRPEEGLSLGSRKYDGWGGGEGLALVLPPGTKTTSPGGSWMGAPIKARFEQNVHS